MALPGPFLAGQRLTAGQLNDATQKTISTIEVGIAGIIATTSGTTQLDIPELTFGPIDLVAGALYRWDVRATLQMNVSGAQEYNWVIRRDTPLTGTAVSDWVVYNQVGTGGFQFVAWDEFIATTDETGVMFYTSVVRLNGANTMNVYGQSSGSNRTTQSLKRVGYSSELTVVT